jgi:hypothetical protein
MFYEFDMWHMVLDNGVICVFIIQNNHVYEIQFASMSCFEVFCKANAQFINILKPEEKLSQKVIDEINRIE